jgi:uncharacterized protein YndB with AHSA1/START domain
MKPMERKQTLGVTTPDDRTIVMTRLFAAARPPIFDAFTKPELIKRWLLGPDGWSMPVCEVDLRVGGTFHYVWRNDSDGRQFGMGGVYREVDPPERVVHVEKFDEPWYPGEAVITTVLSERDGATLLTLTSLFESREARDMALESGMTGGVEASYDRLAELLESA